MNNSHQNRFRICFKCQMDTCCTDIIKQTKAFIMKYMHIKSHLFTSLLSCEMKNPTVFEVIFFPFGFIAILFSSFSNSLLTSIASNNTLSLTKHILWGKKKQFLKIVIFLKSSRYLVALLRSFWKKHSSKAWRQGFCIHLKSSS